MKCKNCGEPIEWVAGSGWNHQGRGALCYDAMTMLTTKMYTGKDITAWAEPESQ